MERVFSGYCRVLDGARMVLCEKDGETWDIDCNFDGCAYAAECPVGKQIAELLREETA